MKNLLAKEMKLAASPLSYLFLAFAVMTFIPGYPILVGAFFICFGIFQSFQTGRENNDILYTVLLPVRKTDVVKGKYAFVCLIELLGFAACLVFTIVRMVFLPAAAPYANNALMNANPLYLAYILLIYVLFNAIFVRGYFKTGYRFAKPLVLFIIFAFLLIVAAEVIHHIPALSFFNAGSSADAEGKFYILWLILLAAAVVYVLGTLASYRSAKKLFELVDLA